MEIKEIKKKNVGKGDALFKWLAALFKSYYSHFDLQSTREGSIPCNFYNLYSTILKINNGKGGSQQDVASYLISLFIELLFIIGIW